MVSRSEKVVFNYILNFRGVTLFRLCLLETQVLVISFTLAAPQQVPILQSELSEIR